MSPPPSNPPASSPLTEEAIQTAVALCEPEARDPRLEKILNALAFEIDLQQTLVLARNKQADQIRAELEQMEDEVNEQEMRLSALRDARDAVKEVVTTE